MVDHEDDWMNPKSVSWQSPPPPKMGEIEYLIERAKRQICFGSPGSIVQWHFWSKHDTAQKRDEELKRLSDEHPLWHLRARNSHPYMERLGIYPSISHPGINE